MDTKITKYTESEFQDLVGQLMTLVITANDILLGKKEVEIKGEGLSLTDVIRHNRSRKLPSGLRTESNVIESINKALKDNPFQACAIVDTPSRVAIEFTVSKDISTLSMVLIKQYLLEEYSSEVVLQPELNIIAFSKTE